MCFQTFPMASSFGGCIQLLIEPSNRRNGTYTYNGKVLNPLTHLPQRALNLKSGVLPIFLQEALKHLNIDH